MTPKLRYSLIVVNIIAICIATVWMHNSKYDFEPIIVVIGFVGSLITLIYPLFNKDKEEIETNTNQFQEDKIRVNGDNNITMGGKQNNSTITINQRNNDKN